MLFLILNYLSGGGQEWNATNFNCSTPLSLISLLVRLWIDFTLPLTTTISRQFCSSKWTWVVEFTASLYIHAGYELRPSSTLLFCNHRHEVVPIPFPSPSHTHLYSVSKFRMASRMAFDRSQPTLPITSSNSSRNSGEAETVNLRLKPGLNYRV